jgi:glucose/arabinose dehydrogenase/plastocyanin
MRTSRAVVLVAALIGALAVGSVPARAASTVTATTQAFTFVPPLVSVAPGDSLQLKNADIAPHNLTSVDGSFSSTDVQPGATASVTGVEALPAGAYQFYCTLHPWMRGVLNVGAAPSTPPIPAPGFGALPVGGAVVTPTSIAASNGSMYVTSYATGVVSKLPILPGGLLGPAQPFASGFTNPLGVTVDGDGTVYVSDSHTSSTPNRSTDGRVWRVSPDGTTKAIVIDGLPNGRHNTNGLAIHNGRLYITNGSSTDNGTPDSGTGPPEVPGRSGSLLSVPIDAVGLTSDSAEVAVAATGMRNIYDVDFRPGTNEAWLSMNGPDTFDPYGEDLLLKADVAATPADFGFPGCLYSSSATPSPEQNPAVASGPYLDLCDGAQAAPEQLLGMHVSADGITFDHDATYVYIAEFGNFFGSAVVGHKVVRVPVDVNGMTGPPQDVIVGGAPLGVAATADGVYVADFATGQITLIKALA